MFLKLADIEGNADHKDHEGWIDIKSLSTGVSHTVDPAKRGKDIRNVCDHQGVVVTKHVDQASPRLAAFCTFGKCWGTYEDSDPGAQIDVLDKDRVNLRYKIELFGVAIGAVSTSAHAGETDETLVLVYNQIQWTFFDEGKEIAKEYYIRSKSESSVK